jgi:maleamate amidohydrolase
MVEPDFQVFERQGYGQRIGFGISPALLIVDFQKGFHDPALFGSSDIANAINLTKELLAACRERGLPIAYTRHVYRDDKSDMGLFAYKVPAQEILTESSEASQIAPELAPQSGDLVISKRYPSAFFATDLAALLRLRGVDTLLMAGCSTSGCIHASVVDAMGSGFRPIIVRECVGDRYAMSHDAALLNMDMKYGDVILRDEAIAHIRAMPARSTRNAAEKTV